MKMVSRKKIYLIIAYIFVFGSTACQSLREIPVAEISSPVPSPDLQNLPTEFTGTNGIKIQQWASGAEASTEYANPEWGSEQVLGAPDTFNCGDYQTSWATAGSDTVDTLVLTYVVPVHVTAVNITQSFNPNQVVKVELLDSFGRPTVVYDLPPVQIDQPCPYTLSVGVDKTEKRFNHIRITIDQSVLGLGWNQIDAVQLVGERE